MEFSFERVDDFLGKDVEKLMGRSVVTNNNNNNNNNP